MRHDALSDAEETDEPVRRSPVRAVLTLSALGLGVAAAIGAVWIFRVPLAGGLIRGQLAAGGIDSAFDIERLDLGGADLSGIRLGPETLPDAAAMRAEVRFGWHGLLPGIDVIRLIEPRLRARVSEQGVSLGSLDSLTQGPPGRRGETPNWRLEVIGGEALIDTPFGAVPATFTARGRLREDFHAEARIADAARTVGADVLRGGALLFTAHSTQAGVRADLNFTADALTRRGAGGENLRLVARLDAPNDLSRADIAFSWSAAEIHASGLSAENMSGSARLAGALQTTQFAFETWSGAARAEAGALIAGDARAETARFDANLTGDAERGAGRWTLATASARTPDWAAGDLRAGGEARIRFGDALGADVAGILETPRAELTARGREGWRRAWPELGGTPLGPLFVGGRDATLRGLTNFTLRAPFVYTLRDGVSGLAFRETVEARAASGARVRVSPLRVNGPLFATRFDNGAVAGAARLEISGGALPDASWSIEEIAGGGNAPIEARGALTLADWRAGAARLRAPEAQARLSLSGARGRLRLTGPITLSGPAGAGAVRDLSAPLDLNISWGDGFRVVSHESGCIPARFAGLTLPGLQLANGALSLCPEGDAFFAISAANQVSGGFNLERLALAGHMEGEPAQRVTLNMQRIAGRFSGASARTVLDVVATAPSLTILMAPERTLAVRGARLTARTVSANRTWRAEGVFEDGVLTDPAIAANVTDIAARWTAEPRGRDALLHILDGQARFTDRAPDAAPADRRAAFNPLLLSDVTADLIDGALVGRGAILLEAGRRPLGTFDADHDLETATGEARVRMRDLTFAPRGLQPYQISELARGVVENVRGPLEADMDVRWTPTTLTARGRVALTDVSLSSSTLPIIEGVTGEIVFDDLFTLSTPPGQRLQIGLLNPGVEVRDGVIQFQMLADGRLALEGARWPFAGGALEVQPTTLTLGAEETRFRLVMRDVDVQLLLHQLNVPDLTATGRVEGEFPLLLTPTTALIENGTLRTAPGGGAIAYTGSARENTQGVARLAFDALTSFHYDDLALVLNGDLGGDVITTINFSGRNAAALNMESVTPGGVPTFGGANIPFRFNVRVTAPFRRLADTAASLGDATTLINRAQPPELPPDLAPEQPAPIDPAPNTPR